ncbi:MAG TPA: tRNA epoxyqueuosine(34) reductase QueG [Fimbriimonas sp.]|nr:tRNA epoxyqueuosine(34) reductase QueG [Fimbriimonas sp.]
MTKDELKARAADLGFSAVGICDAKPSEHMPFYQQWLARGFHGEMDYLQRHLTVKSDPRRLLPSAQSVIVVALDYNRPSPKRMGYPRISRYALGRDYHKVLRSKLKKLAAEIPGQTRACVDSAPVLERDYAQKAGIGWFGKNTCLIDSKRGSWFFLGVLLTSERFEPDAPAVGGCGTCRRCIDACPTGAIVFEGERWQVDARRCISYLTIEHRREISAELEAGIGDWTFGCDVCQEVCPFNEIRATQPLRAGMAHEADIVQDRVWPTLTELAEMSESEWDVLTRGSAVRRAGWQGLRRNALINLRQARSEPTAGM